MKTSLLCKAALYMSVATLSASLSAFGQQQDTSRTYLADSLVLTATRAGDKAPVAFTNLSAEYLQKRNAGVDMPFLLDQTPSVVVTSDAGTGVGYTGIRVRGSDPTRINITINGVPINDTESQAVYWVNMPDLASSADGVQIQRGVGTSTNGAGAFGASINVQTNKVKPDPYAAVVLGGGSFGTRRMSAQFGTGLLHDHWSVDGRLSDIASDGYIERSAAKLRSYYFSGGYAGNRANIRFITFSGHELTHQAWSGVPKDSLATNRRYNPYTYENEVDDYTQTHYQLHTSFQLADALSYSGALHYTKGAGYYEQNRLGDLLADYGLQPVYVGGDTITTTSLIRRRWLDNDFYGITYAFTYTKSRLTAILGGGANQYLGGHYGEVIWAQYASNGNIRHRYYEDDAKKNDVNVFAKATYQLTGKLSLFGDVQWRRVGYQFVGLNNNLENVTQRSIMPFWNPKGGATYQWAKSQVYASYSVAHREPNRNDFTQSTPSNRPKAEALYDLEAGYKAWGKTWKAEADFYRMDYRNELVLTGELNDVGAAIRANVPASYRMGLEFSGGVMLAKKLHLNANATFSRNKIASFTEYVDDFDTGTARTQTYKNTDIAYSPNVIAGAELGWDCLKTSRSSLSATWVTKYVGKQYLDNTQNADRALNAWFVSDLRINGAVQHLLGCQEISLTLMARNLLNHLYEANGWAYSYYYSGQRQADIGYFPQAGRNVLASLTVRF